MKTSSLDLKNTTSTPEFKSRLKSRLKPIEKSIFGTSESVNNEQEIDYKFYIERARELRSKEIRKTLSSIKRYVLSLTK